MNTEHMIIRAAPARSSTGRSLQGTTVIRAENRDGVHAYGSASDLLALFPTAHVEGSAQGKGGVLHREDDYGVCSDKKCWKHRTFDPMNGIPWQRREFPKGPGKRGRELLAAEQEHGGPRLVQ